MFDLDRWQEIGAALAGNKLRTALTAFGVFWGLFMLVAMLGVGNGLSTGVTSDFRGATNSVFIWTQRTSIPYSGLPVGRWFPLRNADYEAITELVPEAAVISPRSQLGGFRQGNNVTRGSRSGGFSVMGDYPQIHKIMPIDITAGRRLNEFDLRDRRKVAVIGPRVQSVLFDRGEDPLGKSIQINGVYFQVIGTFSVSSSGGDGERDAQRIYVPFTTYQRAFNQGDRIGWFAIASQDGVPASVAGKKVMDVLKERHRVHPDDERAFGNYNTEEEFGQLKGLFFAIDALVWIVGIGTLAAGVIGVSNIMLIIIKERTKEIGLRRAVGATPASIVGQIVMESTVLTGVAGYMGLFVGVVVLELARAAMPPGGFDMFAPPGVELGDALVALAVLVGCGVLAGMIPARRALAISPVEALRAE